MKILNKTKGDLALTPEHVVPAMGSADIPEDVLESVSQNKVVVHWVESGFLVPEGDLPEATVDDDPAPDPDKATKPKAKSKKRKGLEAQAGELDIEFTDETSDEELSKAIEEALNA